MKFKMRTLVSRGFVVGGTILGLLACVSARFDFDGYLNSSLGKALSESQYDRYATQFMSPKKLLLEEDQNTYTFRYWYKQSACAWDIDVEKKTNLILRWRYSSKKASEDCRNLPARSNV
jgi:hypothetical protein